MASRTAVLAVKIIGDAKSATTALDQTEAKTSKAGAAFGKFGKVAAVGVAVAGAAAIKFAGDAIGAASRTQQAFGALDAIYGKNAKAVKQWANQAADSVGLAKSEYAELSSIVGSQLQNMGQSQEKAAKSSDALIKKGADLAATFGGSVADAVSAVSSLLKGERDPIERYGVSIKQADINARLAKLGLDGLTGAAAKQAEAQALLSLLNEQTAKTTGAFARESNTLAGQQERLSAKIENVKSKIGTALLPVVTKIVAFISDKFLPGVSRLARQFSERFGPAIERVSAFIKDRLIPAARDIIRWFMEKIAPGIQRTVTPIIEGLRRAFEKVSAKIAENRPQLEKLREFLKRAAEFIANKVLPILGKFYGEYLSKLADALGVVIDAVAKLIDFFDTLIGKVGSFVDKIKGIDLPDLNPFNRSIVVGAGVSTGGGLPVRGGNTYNIQFSGFIGDKNDVVQTLRRELDRLERRPGR